MKQRGLGVNFNAAGEAEVRLWAPLASAVHLFLVRGGQQLAMEAEAHGYWTLTTGQLQPGDPYQFLVDDRQPLPDPASLAQPQGVHGPSVAIDLKTFAALNNDWQNPPLADYMIYELHTGTFTPDGTFKGVIGKLEHLKNLGINAIELMPVAQFPGERNWGYDGVFPFAVQHSYGGAAGLKDLVDACHAQGIAVILDVVYNHLGPEGNYFPVYGPYFTEKYHTPWGNALNFDDAGCDEVRRYFIENVLMWFRDFHIDALRLDAVHAIRDFSPKHILQEMSEQVAELMAATGRLHHLIVECDLNDRRYISPVATGGFGIDAQWIDEFHHALRVTAGGNPDGYYADFRGIVHLAKAYRDAYVFDGQFSPHRDKKFGTSAAGLPGDRFIVFSQNHDQVGNRMLGERSSQLFDFEMQKLMAGAVMIAPFIPMLFMGEEWAAAEPFQYFVSHGDPDLVKAVREGRKAEFASFQAEGEAPDPQAEETFRRSTLNWEASASGHHQVMLVYYQRLIALRKQIPALSRPDREQCSVLVDELGQTLLLERWDGPRQIACLLNFAATEQEFIFREGHAWQVLLDSADTPWGGPGAGTLSGATVKIKPHSLIIYANYHV